MDQFVVDVGDDPIEPGDEAVLFGPGRHGEPLAEDWAQASGTIAYEIVARIGGRAVRRVHRGSGVTDVYSARTTSRGRRGAELVGLAVGALAAGAAAGAAAERFAVRRALGRDDPMRDEPFGTLRGAPYPVTASDGVALHVEIDEPHGRPGLLHRSRSCSATGTR